MARADAARRALRTFAGEGLRMALLSGFSLALGYALTAVLVAWAGMPAPTAYGVAVVACSIVNFFGCRGFVFAGPKAPLWQEALRFFPSVLLFRALEVALFSLLHAAWRNYHLAYFATAAASMLAKLLWSKWFIFRRPLP